MSNRKYNYPARLLFLALIVCTSCSDEKNSAEQKTNTTAPRFELLTKENSGFYFQNELRESEELNILTYQYLYNGGGVAVGDLDNDGLEDIFMVGNLFGGRVYKNLGNLQFRQMSETANVFCDGFSSGVTMADVNNDGWLDIYICRTLSDQPSLRGNILLINNKDFTFTNKATEFGIDDKGFSSHATFFDYDRDDDLDLFVLNHRYDFGNALNILENYETDRISNYSDSIIYYGSNRLYRNEGNGKFTDISKQARINDFAFGLSATVADINNDGWPDIYVANDFYDKDRLYINSGKGYFVDSLSHFMAITSRNSMGCDIADFNNDGLPDLFVPDMMAEDNLRQKQLKGPTSYDIYQAASEKGYYHQVMRNTLQLNNGNGTFSEIGQYAGVSHTDWSWAPLFTDVDNDGWKDLFITNGYYRDVTDLDYVKYDTPLVPVGKKTETFELVKRGKINPISNYLYSNNSDLTFSDHTAAAGLGTPTHSQGAIFCDLDHDGDQDLIINNLHQPSMIYANRSERDSLINNWIQLQTKYIGYNNEGIGTKIYVYTGETKQFNEVSKTHGYLSCGVSLLHFGLKQSTTVDSIVAVWPNGIAESFKTFKVNSRNELQYGKGKKTKLPQIQVAPKQANWVWNSDAIQHTHFESKYIDFKNDPLIEFTYSENGPDCVTGDVNGDGLDDVVFGGSAGMPTELHLQQTNGQFKKREIPAFTLDKTYEDGKLILFDADKDGDQDLFITSCDFEGLKDFHQPRLYLNNGKGDFIKSNDALPPISEYTYAAAAGDFDGDGDQDIFVGGAYRYNSYPKSDAGFLLINKSGKFTKSPITNSGARTGMIMDVAVADINKDKLDDLIFAGEWTGIHVFLGEKKGLVERSKEWGLEHYTGLWSALCVADVNGDGQLDIVAGNRGTNTFFKPRHDVTARLYYHDFDNNGKIDPIPMFPYKDGVRYPKHTLDVLFTQLPKVRKIYNRYSQFSSANEKLILSGLGNEKAEYLEAHTFETTLLLNDGKKFNKQQLPASAQFVPINSIEIADVNADGRNDIILIGNRNHTDVDNGRCAANGITILSSTDKGFQTLYGPFQRQYAFSDMRAIALVNKGTKVSAFITQNNGRSLAAKW
jgi:hypothetical protein